MTPRPPGTLVLLRHGESEWNKANLFTGWVDVPLSEKGRGGGRARRRAAGRARPAARRAAHVGAAPGHQHRRAGAGRGRPAVDPGARGRGGSTSGTTARCRARTRPRPSPSSARSSSCSGAARTTRPPPPIEPGSEFAQDDDPRYAFLPPEARPATECLKDVVVRMLPYWYDAIVPGPAQRRDRARRRARQQPPGAGQAPRRHGRRRGRGAEHPDRRPAALRPGRRPAADHPGRCSTSTRTRPRPRSRPSRTRARSSRSVGSVRRTFEWRSPVTR